MPPPSRDTLSRIVLTITVSWPGVAQIPAVENVIVDLVETAVDLEIDHAERSRQHRES